MTNSGGAIYCLSCTLKAEGENSFDNNYSTSGGAIYAVGSQLFLSGTVNFAKNTASIEGGGMYLHSSSAQFMEFHLKETLQYKKGEVCVHG